MKKVKKNKKNIGIKLQILLPVIFVIIILVGVVSGVSSFLLKTGFFKVKYSVNEKLEKMKENTITNTENFSSEVNKSLSKTSEKIKEGKENQLKNSIKQAAKAGNKFIDNKIEMNSKMVNIVSKTSKVVNLMTDALVEKDTRPMLDKKSGYYVQRFKQTGSILLFTSFLNDIKKETWSNSPIGLNLFIKNGMVIATSKFKYGELKKSYNNKNISDMIKKKKELRDVVDSKDGLAIQIYEPIIDSLHQIAGGFVVTLPINSEFIDELKAYIGVDIVLYNKWKSYTSTFGGHRRLKLEDEKDLFEKIKNSDLVIKDTKIKDKNYRIAYVPIKDKENNVKGMIGFVVSTESLYATLQKLDSDKSKLLKTIGNMKDNSIKSFEEDEKSIIQNLDETQSSTLKSSNNIIIILVIIGAIVSSLIIVFVISKIAKKILEILNITNYVSNGDLTKEVIIKNEDELGKLGIGINAMVDNLKNIVKMILNVSDNSVKSVDEINKLSDKNQVTVTEFVKDFHKVGEKLLLEVREIENMNTSLEEINIAAEELSRNITEINDRSESASDMAKEGSSYIEKAVDSINRIEREVREISRLENKLIDKFNSIEKFVGVINQISEQTNLLALNAAIEAARAGDAGKGFAVVANEVKKLAEESVQAASDIENMVLDMRQESENVKSSINIGLNEVESGVEVYAKTGEFLKQIIGAIENINDMIRNSVAATEEQSANITSGMTAMNEMHKEVLEIKGVMEKLTGSSKELIDNSEEIDNGIGKIEMEVLKIRDKISEFVVDDKNEIKQMKEVNKK
ncbi:methyl-accepting chemotaxis protein [Haliovirga abyssi]|uniref:Methyl-accepting chemotaxis protein n=1 Tax=Haliovirga abyssi TaxID=2996794 RepID=A0AAU9DF82_9FUSO|nr:methyl-accepting chemotaxis protein [Haliovirga abyssi]BDU50858.1 hypothetical protein HLVA_14270 [Haliovirga abyssi]